MSVPDRLTLKPLTGDDCAISRAFPLAMPAATSNNTTLANPFSAIKWAKVPPICPAPIKVIFFIKLLYCYFIVGITNSGSDLRPEGHLDVTVFSFV